MKKKTTRRGKAKIKIVKLPGRLMVIGEYKPDRSLARRANAWLMSSKDDPLDGDVGPVGKSSRKKSAPGERA